MPTFTSPKRTVKYTAWRGVDARLVNRDIGSLLCENGDFLVQEAGDNILIEGDVLVPPFRAPKRVVKYTADRS